MAISQTLRAALQLSVALTCVLVLSARPALACYCVEETSCESIELSAVPGSMENPEVPAPNQYVVQITWAQYVNDCEFSVEGTSPELEGWTQVSECVVDQETGAPNGDSKYYTGTAVCTVQATGTSEDSVYGTTWTFKVTGEEDGTSCTTDIFLPSVLPEPTDPEVAYDPERGTTALITWTPPTGRKVATGLTAVQRYDVYRSAPYSDPTKKRLGTTTATSFTDSTVKAGRTYRYEIYAADEYGHGSAAVVTINGSDRPSSGCASAGPIAPFGLALFAASMFLRRRRRDGR